MQHLQRALSGYFKPTAARKPDPAYAKFRSYCDGLGVTYKIARDGFIEFSDGVVFGHYGDWSETMQGHIEVAAALERSRSKALKA